MENALLPKLAKIVKIERITPTEKLLQAEIRQELPDSGLLALNRADHAFDR
jgi:hypothetical protein